MFVVKSTNADTFGFNKNFFKICCISANAIDLTLQVTIRLFRRLQQAKELVKQVRGYRKQ